MNEFKRKFRQATYESLEAKKRQDAADNYARSESERNEIQRRKQANNQEEQKDRVYRSLVESAPPTTAGILARLEAVDKLQFVLQQKELGWRGTFPFNKPRYFTQKLGSDYGSPLEMGCLLTQENLAEHIEYASGQHDDSHSYDGGPYGTGVMEKRFMDKGILVSTRSYLDRDHHEIDIYLGNFRLGELFLGIGVSNKKIIVHGNDYIQIPYNDQNFPNIKQQFDDFIIRAFHSPRTYRGVDEVQKAFN